MIVQSDAPGVLLDLPTVKKWDRAANRVLREDWRHRQDRGQKNVATPETAFVQITSQEATGDVFEGVIITPADEDIPSEWAGDQASAEPGPDAYVAFANVDPDDLVILDEPILLCRRVGVRSVSSGELRPLFAHSLLHLQYRGRLTAQLAYNASAAVEFNSSSGPTGISRTCRSWMLGTTDTIAAGTEVVVALMPGNESLLAWYVIAAGCEAVAGAPGGGSISYTPPPYFPANYFPLE